MGRPEQHSVLDASGGGSLPPSDASLARLSPEDRVCMERTPDDGEFANIVDWLREDTRRMRRCKGIAEERDAVRLAATAGDLGEHPRLKGWLWNRGTPSVGKGHAWTPGRPAIYWHPATGSWACKTWEGVYGVTSHYYFVSRDLATATGYETLDACVQAVQACEAGA